jgi:hypothetical protein
MQQGLLFVEFTEGRCAYCHRRKAQRSSGLCTRCTHDPEARQMHPPTSIFARRGVLDHYGGHRLPAEATRTVPGTAERLAVLAARAEAGEALARPGDLTLDGVAMAKHLGWRHGGEVVGDRRLAVAFDPVAF